MKGKLTGKEKRWIMYDVGNSAFTLLISTIMPIYFNYLAGKFFDIDKKLDLNAIANIKIDE